MSVGKAAGVKGIQWCYWERRLWWSVSGRLSGTSGRVKGETSKPWTAVYIRDGTLLTSTEKGHRMVDRTRWWSFEPPVHFDRDRTEGWGEALFFSLSEVTKIIKQFCSGKATETDEIPPDVLKALGIEGCPSCHALSTLRGDWVWYQKRGIPGWQDHSQYSAQHTMMLRVIPGVP